MNNNTKAHLIEARRQGGSAVEVSIPLGGEKHGVEGFRTRTINFTTRHKARVGSGGKVGNCRNGQQ